MASKGMSFVGNVAAVRTTNKDGVVLTDKNGHPMASVVVIKNIGTTKIVTEGLVFGVVNILLAQECAKTGDLVDIKTVGRRDTSWVDNDGAERPAVSGILTSLKVISRCTGTHPKTGKKIYATPRNSYFAPARTKAEVAVEATAEVAVADDAEVNVN